MKKTWVRVLALTLALMLLLTTFCTSALAANNFSNIKGTANKNATIKRWRLTVKTGKTWFSSPKITFSFVDGIGTNRSTKMKEPRIGCWWIQVLNSKGKELKNVFNWGRSITISGTLGGLLGTLQRNSTYKINITYDGLSTLAGGHFPSFDKAPSWYISSTNNIASIKWA